MVPTFEEWSAVFWEELVLVDDSLRHYTFSGDTRAYHLVIDPNGFNDGGVVRLSRYDGKGAVRRVGFSLADAPAKVAAKVGALVVPRASASSDLLASMRRPEFLRAVRRAELEATSANNLRAVLLLWSARLLPHLERDSELTVLEALERYRAERRSRS